MAEEWQLRYVGKEAKEIAAWSQFGRILWL